MIEEYLKTAKVFCQTNRHIPYPGQPAGWWVMRIRKLRQDGKLSQSLRKKLKELPIAWDNWNDWFDSLLELDSPTPDFFSEWCLEQKKLFLDGSLSSEQEKYLEHIPGWDFFDVPELNTHDVNHKEARERRIWKKHYSELEKLVKGGLIFPFKGYTGKTLGTWFCKQRARYLKEEMHSDQLELMSSLHPTWFWTQARFRWQAAFDALADFLNQNGRLPEKRNLEYHGIDIGSWVRTQRMRNKNGLMKPDECELLNKLEGWKWQQWADDWKDSFAKFCEESQREKLSKESNYWANTQRRRKIEGRMSQEQIELLSGHSHWSWDPLKESKQLRLEQISLFVDQHNRLPMKEEWFNGQKIGSFCVKLRMDYKKGLLTKDVIAFMETVPLWTWNQLEKQWLENFNQLKEFIRVQERIPNQNNSDETEKSLRLWLDRQKDAFRNKSISSKHWKMLSALPGVSLRNRKVYWFQRAEELKVFIKKNGRYPKSGKEEGGLYQWVQGQKKNKTRLPQERIACLEHLFDWKW